MNDANEELKRLKLRANLAETLLIERVIELTKQAYCTNEDKQITKVAERMRRACVDAVDGVYRKCEGPTERNYHRGPLEAVLRNVNISLDEICDSLKPTA